MGSKILLEGIKRIDKNQSKTYNNQIEAVEEWKMKQVKTKEHKMLSSERQSCEVKN